ncbi:MAG: hypothetical protein ACRDYC_10370, partial [Acidimicrobiales bacterium]
DDDAGRATWWIGDAWWRAVADLGLPGPPTSVWRGVMSRAPWSDLVCFAGRAPGELVSDAGKVVGISQRRSRAGALFQCGAALTWDPRLLLELLDIPEPDRDRAATDLATAASPLGAAGRRLLEEAFLHHLPTGS